MGDGRLNLSTPYLLIVDFEATCGNVPNHEMEIIDWGAVLLDAEDLACLHSEADAFDSPVRPTLHPLLSEFCRDLTGISQQAVSWASSFETAFQTFQSWLHKLCPQEQVLEQVTFGAWGEFDRKQLLRQCAEAGLEAPFENWINLRTEMTRALGIPKNGKSNVQSVVELMGGQFVGKPHRALADCLTIAEILKRAKKKCLI